MSTTKDAYEAPNISQQFTRMKSSSTKLEWRIENFQKAIRFYQRDQSFSSKTFIVPHLRVVWQLDVYPSGRGGNVHPWFYLRLIGFQTPEGSLSADKAKVAKMFQKVEPARKYFPEIAVNMGKN